MLINVSTTVLVPVLYLLGAAQGGFLACALLSSRVGNRRANRYLGCLTLLFALSLLSYCIALIDTQQLYPQVQTVLWPKEFLYGVLIYSYTRELTHPERFFWVGRQWWHFFPALIHVVVTWPLLLLEGSVQQQVLSAEIDTANPILTAWSLLLGNVELCLAIIHLSVYFALSMRLLYRHKRRVMDNFSYTETLSLNWLRNLLAGLMVVYLFWLISELFDDPEGYSGMLEALLGLSIVAFIYLMGYLGLRQPLIFSSRERSPKPPLDTELATAPAPETDYIDDNPTLKYKHSSLSSELAMALINEVEQTMQTQQLYLDSQLSLPKLAQRLGVSANYLSQAINEQRGQHFFDFVNRYRVDAVLDVLQQPNHSFTILDMAMNAGFNSKSAFYSAFRKHTGKTPSQYRKEILNTATPS